MWNPPVGTFRNETRNPCPFHRLCTEDVWCASTHVAWRQSRPGTGYTMTSCTWKGFPHYCPFEKGTTGHRWILLTKRKWCGTAITSITPPIILNSWWRHQMKTFSALLALCAGNSPVTGEFPSQRPVTLSFKFSLIRAWTNGRTNYGNAGDLRRHRAHYDVIVI